MVTLISTELVDSQKDTVHQNTELSMIYMDLITSAERVAGEQYVIVELQ